MTVPALEPGSRVVVREYGETPLDTLAEDAGLAGHVELVDQPAPDPAALKPREVLVAVERAAINWVDLLMLSGQYQHMAPPPYTPGLEYAGIVVAVGAEVRDLEPGAKVISDGLVTGPRSLGAYQSQGGFARWALAPRDALHRLPGPLSLDQGCNLIGNYATAYHCLVHRGRVQPGETVLINGATGSTGLAAVDLAKRLGATVIATGRDPSKLAEVSARGADHVVAIGVGEGPGEGELVPGAGIRSFRAEVKALTKGRGVDVVYDGVGGPISVESMRCCSFGARYLVVGWAATPFVAKGKGGRGAPQVNTVPTNLILIKSLDVLGCPAAISAHHDPRLHTTRLRELLAWAEAGEIAPLVAGSYALSDFRAGMRAKWARAEVGNLVLDTTR